MPFLLLIVEQILLHLEISAMYAIMARALCGRNTLLSNRSDLYPGDMSAVYTNHQQAARHVLKAKLVLTCKN